jgi:copper chaperone NosL
MRALLTALLVAACTVPGPRPVVVGSDLCAHCHMMVADERFVAQLVTATGKVLVYDDAGCLATALAEGVVAETQVGSLWVTDFLTPASLLPADSAWFVQSEAIGTPMASGLAAVGNLRQADSLASALGGAVLRWDAVRRDTGHGH